MLVSVIIPVFNEAESLPFLLDELRAMGRDEHLPLEIILVDDGSSDGSWDLIARTAASSSDVVGVRLRRNAGKAQALLAGRQAARGECLVTLDADLQDDPREIPRLVAAVSGELDLVTGWRRRRADPVAKVLPSRVFNFLVRALTGVRLHDHNCGLKGFRAEIFDELPWYGGLYRFPAVFAHLRGYRVGELEVNHRARRFGRSKYGAGRFWNAVLDLFTVTFLAGFGQRPQHVLGGLGLASLLVGSAGVSWLAAVWVLQQFVWGGTGGSIAARPLLGYSILALLLGFHMITFGCLAELIVAGQTGRRNAPPPLETLRGPPPPGAG